MTLEPAESAEQGFVEAPISPLAWVRRPLQRRRDAEMAEKRGDKRGAAAAGEAAAPKRRPGLSVAPAGRQNGASGTSSAQSRNSAPMPAAHIALAAKVRAAPLQPVF